MNDVNEFIQTAIEKLNDRIYFILFFDTDGHLW